MKYYFLIILAFLAYGDEHTEYNGFEYKTDIKWGKNQEIPILKNFNRIKLNNLNLKRIMYQDINQMNPDSKFLRESYTFDYYHDIQAEDGLKSKFASDHTYHYLVEISEEQQKELFQKERKVFLSTNFDNLIEIYIDNKLIAQQKNFLLLNADMLQQGTITIKTKSIAFNHGLLHFELYDKFEEILITKQSSQQNLKLPTKGKWQQLYSTLNLKNKSFFVKRTYICPTKESLKNIFIAWPSYINKLWINKVEIKPNMKLDKILKQGDNEIIFHTKHINYRGLQELKIYKINPTWIKKTIHYTPEINVIIDNKEPCKVFINGKYAQFLPANNQFFAIDKKHLQQGENILEICILSNNFKNSDLNIYFQRQHIISSTFQGKDKEVILQKESPSVKQLLVLEQDKAFHCPMPNFESYKSSFLMQHTSYNTSFFIPQRQLKQQDFSLSFARKDLSNQANFPKEIIINGKKLGLHNNISTITKYLHEGNNTITFQTKNKKIFHPFVINKKSKDNLTNFIIDEINQDIIKGRVLNDQELSFNGTNIKIKDNSFSFKPKLKFGENKLIFKHNKLEATYFIKANKTKNAFYNFNNFAHYPTILKNDLNTIYNTKDLSLLIVLNNHTSLLELIKDRIKTSLIINKKDNLTIKLLNEIPLFVEQSFNFKEKFCSFLRKEDPLLCHKKTNQELIKLYFNSDYKNKFKKKHLNEANNVLKELIKECNITYNFVP